MGLYACRDEDDNGLVLTPCWHAGRGVDYVAAQIIAAMDQAGPAVADKLLGQQRPAGLTRRSLSRPADRSTDRGGARCAMPITGSRDVVIVGLLTAATPRGGREGVVPAVGSPRISSRE